MYIRCVLTPWRRGKRQKLGWHRQLYDNSHERLSRQSEGSVAFYGYI